MEPIYIENDFLVQLNNLVDEDGNQVTTATVQATIRDLAGVAVSGTGITWPITLNHISNGNYEGLVDKRAVFVDGDIYEIEITADVAGTEGTWRFKRVATERRA